MISRERLTNLCQWFKRKSFVICCGIAPIILLFALLLNCNFGCNVIVNGEIIGTAPSEEYVNNLIAGINEDLAPYLNGGDAITVEPTTTPKILFGKDFSTSQELGEALKSYCPYLEKAYSVKSNNRTVVAFETEEERQKCYDNFVKNVTKGSSSYEILDSISFEYELVPYGLIKSGKYAEALLQRTYDFSKTVTLNNNCTLGDILTTYAMTEEQFKALNPKYVEGKTTTAKIKSQIPYIRIVCKQEYVENQILRYSLKFEDNAKMVEGSTALKTEGKNGFIKTAKTRYCLNGVSLYESSKEAEKEDATAQVLMVGTMKKPKGSGDIARPCEGTLTSRYGTRGGRLHKGLDISDDEGTPILAADTGVVVFSGWDESGYGYLVRIDHGNGYMTMYAHCRDLLVAEGDAVNKGDKIATMGNSGRSTGPHLHFEVIDTKTGNTIDPAKFFKI